jgi:hypothetical protein
MRCFAHPVRSQSSIVPPTVSQKDRSASNQTAWPAILQVVVFIGQGWLVCLFSLIGEGLVSRYLPEGSPPCDYY